MTSNSNMSEGLASVYATTEQTAYSMAMGKDGLADTGWTFFEAAERDDAITPGDARQLFTTIQFRASVIAKEKKRKPVKISEGESLNTQVSKLAAYAKLGIFARDNVAVIDAFAWAREMAEGGYTILTRCATLACDLLAKVPNATDAAIREAMGPAFAAKPKTALGEARKIRDALEKLAYGNEKTEAPFPAVFAALLSRYPSDRARHAFDALKDIVTGLEVLEALAKDEQGRA